MVKSVSPSDFFSDANMRTLLEREKSVDFTFLDDDEGDLARELYKRLLALPKKETSNYCSEPGLSLQGMCRFLASVSNAQGRHLGKVVESGLRALGIPRLARRRGRPRGRNAAQQHALFVHLGQRRIENAGVFLRKRELRTRFRQAWRNPFRKQLAQDGWSREDIELLETCNTPRSFAIQKAVRYFRASYDVIADDCPPAKKSTPK